MRSILVLGGTGFLGTNLIDVHERLKKHGGMEAVDFILAGRNPPPVPFGNARFCQVDMADPLALRKVFSDHRIDEVFHLACSTVPSTSNIDIPGDVRSNLTGTLTLLDLMVEFGVHRITFFSSGGTVYGDRKEAAFQEDRLGAPNNSYGILKTAIEHYVRLYHRIFGMEYLILRISNAYGLHHRSLTNGFVNIAMRKALRGETIHVWGDGGITKDYIFASDLADAFWKLYRSNVLNEVVNIGSGTSLSNNRILEAICRLIPDARWEYHPERTFDTRRPEFDFSKLHTLVDMDFTPFDESLRQTFDWERDR